jgi:hypothetical protein
MNDYAHGALEALTWVLGVIEDSDDVGRVRRQVAYSSVGQRHGDAFAPSVAEA